MWWLTLNTYCFYHNKAFFVVVIYGTFALFFTQINAKTELALRYNDISPLENHHCFVAFEVLQKSHCNILRNVSKEEYKKIREGMIR